MVQACEVPPSSAPLSEQAGEYHFLKHISPGICPLGEHTTRPGFNLRPSPEDPGR